VETNKKPMHPLKRFRVNNRYKHREIAEMLGCSIGFPTMIENGIRVGPDLAEKLAKMLKCNKDIFLYPGKYAKRWAQ